MAEANISRHYEVEDKEILLQVFKKFLWNPIVEVLPESLAPNAITIFGQICAILAVVAALGAVSGTLILYPVSAFLMLAYLTADNIDGAHARRTGKCSPLGEFLDHGLDGIASGCVILATAISFHLPPTWLVFIVMFGAIGWILTFWGQSRLGKLVIPAIGAVEGVAIISTLQLVIFFNGDPVWLHFDLAAMNATTIAIIFGVCCYAVAAVAPIVRVWRAGKPLGDIFPAIVIALSAMGYVLAGASPLLPAIAVTIYSADVVCRFIIVRHQGQVATPTHLLHWLIALPLIPAVLLPSVWTASGWAALSLTFAAILYGRNLIRGATTFLADDETSAIEAAV